MTLNLEEKKKESPKQEPPLLGDYLFERETFPNLDTIIVEFQQEGFKNLNETQRTERVHRTLLNLILEAPREAFLLPAVIDYAEKISQSKVLEHPYTFISFEFWLNQFSHLSRDDNYQVRAKIVGRSLPRDEYQLLFPVGMGKIHPGTHFVSAHISPDLDTTVASFWGWIDAFGARVGDGLHVWNLPGGTPPSQISSVFDQLLGNAVFPLFSRHGVTLAPSAMDLVTQKGLVRKQAHEPITSDQGASEKFVILVDQQGFYMGSWRSSDEEGLRQVGSLINNCLRWFENSLQEKLISLFANEHLSINDISPFISSIFDLQIKNCEPAKEMNRQQKKWLQDVICKTFKVRNGLDSTFGEFGSSLAGLSIMEFAEFRSAVESLSNPKLFDHSGYLQENRPRIFHRLEKIIKSLHQAIQSIRNYVDRLDVAIDIKHLVLGHPSEYVTLRADIDEMRSKMGAHEYLPVVQPEKDNRMLPVGIVLSSDLQRSVLGTVSLRDFCNREEIKIAPNLEIISVVDHHKTTLMTTTFPTAIIGDVQSCNILLAEKAFEMNDKYSSGGIIHDQASEMISQGIQQESSLSTLRIIQRALKRRMAVHNKNAYFVHPKREFVEYVSYLYAILDDTDLLTKVSARDVECVASLLNRLKSLIAGREVEIITLDDLPRDQHFAKKAAKRILQNKEMYSLYKKIYSFKEQEIERNFELCCQGKPSTTFADTKEQNRCARVGQTKMFANNYNAFLRDLSALRQTWLQNATEANKSHPDNDLHLHMMSTVVGAEEVYQGGIGNYTHQDELWIWVPQTQEAYDHLASYLNGFKSAPEALDNRMEVEFLGPNAEELSQLFTHHFLDIPQTKAQNTSRGLPLAVLRFNAGSLNSRKAAVTPYLPR